MATPICPTPLTSDLPGCGGVIKKQPEDFEVEEIPAYEPSGQGDHLFLWIEKRGMGAQYFERQIARRLDIPPSEVGAAGLKDRHAVSRQWISVPVSAEPRLPQLEGDGIRVLRVSRHTNKLRTGHLRGNRFRVMVRGADAAQAPIVERILERIRQQGLPNYYGAQRFGRNGETSDMGMKLLRGEQLPRRLNPFMKKLALSAAQSLLFNDYLSRRLKDGLMRKVILGDVMAKWPVGGLFVAEDREREQLRFDARETVHTGPIFGRKTFAAVAEAADREAAVLRDAGLNVQHFSGFGKLAMGTRRHNLVYIDDLTAVWEPIGLRIAFTLPAGSYATILLGEVMKVEFESGDDSEN